MPKERKQKTKSNLRALFVTVLAGCCSLGVIGMVLQSTPEGRARRNATKTAEALALSFTATNTPLPSPTKFPTRTPFPTIPPTRTATRTPTQAPASGGGQTGFDNNGDGRVTCADFQTRAQAQRAYEAGYRNLDGSDNDGKACEGLP